MRILVATTAYPLPVRDGLTLQLAGLLTELHRRHDVVLVAELADGDDLGASSEICSRLVTIPGRAGRRARLQQELSTLRSRRPVLAEQVTSSALPAALRAAVRREQPDVVHLTPGWTAELAADVGGTPVVLAPLDATGPNWEAEAENRSSALGRYLTRREMGRMLAFERSAYPRCDDVVVVTEHDAELLRRSSPALHPHVVTNGVDAAHWARPAAHARVPGLLVLSGAMSYPPNVAAAVHAATEVLPRVRAAGVDARLRIVGRDPSPEVAALRGAHVEVTGTVPDVRPHLWEAAGYLCPMLGGSGVKNKLLEAMAAGCACVVTPLATAGLDLTSGTHVLVAEGPAELADAAGLVLSDPALAARLSRAAADRAVDQSWSRAAAGFEWVYADAIARRRPS